MIPDIEPRWALRSTWLLLGPAFVAAIAYVDPGNVAANVSAGAQFGYLLVWVIVVANAMACLVQYLSAKLGLVTGQSLPEAVGDRMQRRSRLAYWLQAELVAMATDLAEVMGGAIALYLLFDLPLLAGGVITGMVSLMLLVVKDRPHVQDHLVLVQPGQHRGILGTQLLNQTLGLLFFQGHPEALQLDQRHGPAAHLPHRGHHPGAGPADGQGGARLHLNSSAGPPS